jgi:predicted AlkP superfamily phosphohydrolase/phosphomutase
MKKQLFLIGVDGATMDIIAPLAGEGRLPNFARLMGEGVSGLLASTIPCISAVAWTSCSTGTNPGKHGIYDFTERIPGEYAFTVASARGRKASPVWMHLGASGYRVTVVGCTLTYPPDPVNGVMVSGLGIPSRKGVPIVSDYTHPVELASDLNQTFGSYLSVLDVNPRKIVDRLKDEILELIRYRIRVNRYFLTRHATDFNFLFFGETDIASHLFWDDRDFIHDVYGLVDSFLEEVLSIPGATVLLVSDHGFTRRRKVVFVDKWLEAEGYLVRQPPKPFSRFRQIIRRSSPQREYLDRVVWDQTCAFTALSSAGNMFLNVRGREPAGILADDQIAATVASLQSGLSELQDPQTRTSVVERVYQKKEVFAGDHLEKAPDLVVQFREGYGAGMPTIEDQVSGNIVMTDSVYWKGDHHPDGVFMAWGPDINQGIALNRASIVDVAPTILYFFEVPVFHEMDGSVLVDLFSPELIAKNPVKTTLKSLRNAPSGRELTREEEEKIAEVLRNLGYLE